MITKISNEEYVDPETLLKSKVLSKRSIRRIQASNKIKIGSRILIPVDNLSATAKGRLKMLAKDRKIIKGDPADSNEIKMLHEILQLVEKRQDRHRIYESCYEHLLLKENEYNSYTRSHAIIAQLISLKLEGYKVSSIFLAYKRIQEQNPLRNFQCNNYNYFSTKLSNAEEMGIEQVIVHLTKGQVLENCKFTSLHKKYAKHFYMDSKRFKYKLITKMVNDEVIKRGLYSVSIDTIKKFLGQKAIQNYCRPFRVGGKWAKENLFPYLRRLKPKKNNFKWEMDSSSLPFYVWLENGEGLPRRYTYCICIDVKSLKILSWYILPTECTRINEITLLKAITSTGIIPRELVHDNGSSYLSKRFLLIEERIEKRGCLVTLCTPGEPQQKGTIEKLIDLLQVDYLCYEEGWLGKNITSNKIAESVALRETIAAHWDGKKKLYLNDVIGYLDKAVKLFNAGELWTE